MSAVLADQERLEAFDAGWQSALAYMTAGTDLSIQARLIDARIIASREARADRDARRRRLDEAEALGERAYAEERARQGLVRYDRHREFVS